MDPSETGSNLGLEEEEEAFLDINDPENEILDDGGDEGVAATSDDDDDEGDGGEGNQAAAGQRQRGRRQRGASASAAAAGGAACGEEDEEEEEEAPAGIEPTEKEPERDDAAVVFAGARDGKALHCVACSPADARVSAVAGESDEIYVLTAGALTATLEGHTDTITTLAFSPDGATLASGCMDCTVRLWCTATWAPLHVLADLCGEVECLLWHPSSLVIVAGGSDAQTVMWNAKKGAAAQYFVGPRGSVTCAHWACDAKKLITGSADGSVFVFNPKTAAAETVFPTKELSKDGAGVTVLAEVSAGAAAAPAAAASSLGVDVWAAGCEDGTIHVLSLARGKVVQHLAELHEQSIEVLRAAPGLGFLASAACDCKLVIWNTTDFSPRMTISIGEGATCARWIGPLIAVGCTDGDVRVWDGRAATQEPLLRLMGHRRFITALEVVPQTNALLTVSDDATARAFALPEAVLQRCCA